MQSSRERQYESISVCTHSECHDIKCGTHLQVRLHSQYTKQELNILVAARDLIISLLRWYTVITTLGKPLDAPTSHIWIRSRAFHRHFSSLFRSPIIHTLIKMKLNMRQCSAVWEDGICHVEIAKIYIKNKLFKKITIQSNPKPMPHNTLQLVAPYAPPPPHCYSTIWLVQTQKRFSYPAQSKGLP